MRISSQGMDVLVQQNTSPKAASTENTETVVQLQQKSNSKGNIEGNELVNDGKEVTKEKLQQAVEAINEFLEVDHKALKYVLHEGLGEYFVRLVDSDTDEVIKEIPPKRLLDAFYEMQKLVGMIVDEKI